MSRYAFWIAICIFLALVASKFSPGTGFTSLIRFGETWEHRRLPALVDVPIATVPNSNGYDGQFYAQLALDPLLFSPATSAALDVPVYRARRVLTPALAAAAGAGNPQWTLQIYALLNVACWLILGWILYRSLVGSDWTSFARWAGCMFGMGVLESVRQSLVDLPALLLLTLSIRADDRAQSGWSTCWLALAGLAKESSLLGGIALAAENYCWPFTSKRKIIALGLAVIPLAAWSCYIHYRLPNSTGPAGAGNFSWPLLGLIEQIGTCFSQVARGNWDGRYTMGLLAVAGLITQGWVLWRTPNIKSSWWRVGAAYALLLLVLGPWVWSGYWAACRALLPMTVAFNLLLPSNPRSFWALWVIGNSTVVHALWRFL